MSSIVYQIDKKTGTKYAFESTSFWDKEKKQPRSKRKYLGKVDPETGKIIPSRGRSSQPSESKENENDEIRDLQEALKDRDSIIAGLRQDLDRITAQHEQAVATLRQIQTLLKEYPMT